ncbi:MAG TPA: DUF2334 domain-containing protein [bacterium]|nr:DUF2334 domain-containing protein [bacterium]HPN45518.1 DUF2334 domain-containing protein [bacterium]
MTYWQWFGYKIYFKSNIFILSCLLIVQINRVSAKNINLSLDPEPNRINAVRFDPSYYYNSPLKIEQMAAELTDQWKRHGINTIYFKAYDPLYGAKYKTTYTLNTVADYGKLDLLKYILKAAHEKDMQVIAWIPAFLHKAAWEKHPEWRIKNQDGSDYQLTSDNYPLCPATPAVRTWWLGFIRDLMKNYKDLDGIDIAEPIITWNGNHCYCDYCRGSQSTPTISADGLNETITQTVGLIHSYKKIASITTVASIHDNGSIMSPREQMSKTGFDLNRILDNEFRPDWLNVELMWQQWASLHNNDVVFTPEWIRSAAYTVLQQIDSRSNAIAHVEITSFPGVRVNAELLSQTIINAKESGFENIDVYDTHLLDSLRAWSDIAPALDYVPQKRILVLCDGRGENDARQVASLLSHFKTSVELHFLNDKDDNFYIPLDSIDVVFFVGVDPAFTIPAGVLRDLRQYRGTICWVHYGIDQYLGNSTANRYRFTYIQTANDSLVTRVNYKGYELPRIDPTYDVISVSDSSRCKIMAEMTDGTRVLPYVVHCGNLWYFADLPTAFVTEGGSYIVLCDLLHEIVREDHKPKKLAMVRIEDISPLSDIDAMKSVARYLKSQDALFSVSLVPYYLDPESNTAATLSDIPKFVQAINFMQKSGGTVVMHGSTHQFRGETTADYEFWDGMTSRPLFADSREYVRQKIETGLNELRKNGLYPLVWETPHYAASQLDYPVINTFFSTAYERRQTVDLHGSDQLLPYMIYRHTSGGKVIPENLGYIPLESPDPGPMLQAARNNLAIRDGVASFFFHVFVDHTALKKIVPGLKQMGYTFTSPCYTNNRVRDNNFNVISGQGEVDLSLDGEYYHEFYVDENGVTRNESYSDSLLYGVVQKQVTIPQGSYFVAEKVADRPASWWRKTINKITPSVPSLSNTVFTANNQSLMDADVLPVRAAVVLDSSVTGVPGRDQYNFLNALASVGIDAQPINITAFLEIPRNINLLIIPQAAARNLSEHQNLFVIHALQNGLNIILEKQSLLSNNIGMEYTGEYTIVKKIRDEYYPQVEMNWKISDSLQAFSMSVDYETYYSDVDSEWPVIIGGEYGDGNYLYLGTFFDPGTNEGYGRFPYFIDLLKRHFNFAPTIRRNSVEIYFEPGDREDISVEDLIKIWRNNGVRRIYVSGWHFYANYTYDYERLIELAHENAMLVYIWLELPHVTDGFWEQHPEWREKTATGRDAQIDWRKNMALEIKACKQAVFAELDSVLSRYDWDGINFAELYYESPKGFEQPENMTPFNDAARKMFADEYGFDPLSLFDKKSKFYWKLNQTAVDKFWLFRENRIIQLHKDFLEFLYQLKEQQKKDWEIMLTTVDNVFSPDVGQGIAINTRRLLELAGTYPFTLQIEDPLPLWSLGPERYVKILQAYAPLVKASSLVLDINVVPIRDMDITLAPTRQPTGLELYNLTRAASGILNRVAIYSEASLYEIDFPVIPYVLAGPARERLTNEAWEVETPFTVNALLDADAHKDILVNGVIWPAYYRGRVIIPPGHHKIQPVYGTSRFVKRFKSNTRLVDISGELLAAASISRGLELEYESNTPNIVILTEEPREVYLDDTHFVVKALHGEQGYSIRLPAGRHNVKFYTQSKGTQSLKYASMVISGFIVILGALAGIVLSSLYIKSSVRRRK